MAREAEVTRPNKGGRAGTPRLVALVVAVALSWTLAAAHASSPFVPTVAAQTDPGPTTLLPVELDADQDDWVNAVEDGLGSDGSDNGSIPESIAVPLSCWDGLDNDRDGVSDDEDPGCQPIGVMTGTFPQRGSDVFESTMSLADYAFETLLGACNLDFTGTGPVVVERGAPTGGSGSQRTFETEIVAMQLRGTATLLPGSPCNPGSEPITLEVVLIEDPEVASRGTVSSQDATGAVDYPADSFFDVHFKIATPIGLLTGGPPGGPTGDPVSVTNVVNSMPPYHSPANPDLNPDCYAVDRAAHVHCPKPPLDHFLCYAGEFPSGGASDLQLSDQFGQSLSNVGPADRFCNATSKNSLAIFDEGAHLERFAFSADDTADVPQRVRVQNQLGTDQILQVGQPIGLLVPSQKGLEVPPAALDHFKCYSVEGPAPAKAVTLADQFTTGDPRPGSLGPPRTLCNPVAKVHDGIVTPVADPSWHLVCYDVATDVGADRTVRVRNQFVDHSASLGLPVELCVPSMKQVLPEKKEPPPKRHPKLPGTAKYWKIGGYKGFPKDFDVPFEFKSTKPCTYDRLDFRKVQKNKLIYEGPGIAVYRDVDKNYDELTIVLRDPETGRTGAIIITGPGKLLPGNAKVVTILEGLAPTLTSSLASAADHKMPKGLVKAFGLKDTFGVYYGEYEFKNQKRANREMGDFFDRLAEDAESPAAN